LLTQNALSDDDKETLFRMLLATNDALAKDIDPQTPQPLGDLFTHDPSSLTRVLLKEIHSVKGVNALLPDQSIQFNLD
jgi:hypothetical protein